MRCLAKPNHLQSHRLNYTTFSMQKWRGGQKILNCLTVRSSTFLCRSVKMITGAWPLFASLRKLATSLTSTSNGARVENLPRATKTILQRAKQRKLWHQIRRVKWAPVWNLNLRIEVIRAIMSKSSGILSMKNLKKFKNKKWQMIPTAHSLHRSLAFHSLNRWKR